MLTPLVLAGSALSAIVVANSCSDTHALGYAEVWLRDCGGRTRCDGRPAEHVRVEAFFDADVSRYAPHGFYAYFEIGREDGSRGVLELDVETSTDAEHTQAAYDVSYTEQQGERLVFESRRVQGRVSLPQALTDAAGPSCGCADGLFRLAFIDPGLDGHLGTADDRGRRLDFGHLSRDEEPCTQQLPDDDDGDADAEPGLHVAVRPCATPPAPAAHSGTQPAPDAQPAHPQSATRGCVYDCASSSVGAYTSVDLGWGASRYDSGGGCGGHDDTDNDHDYDSGGCASHTYDDYDDGDSGGCASHDYDGDDARYDDSAGCGGSGGTQDDENTSSGQGCSGDTASDDKSASGGCEGDTSDSPSSCSVRPLRRRRGRSASAFIGTGLPLLLVCLWQAARAAQWRRRARHAPRERRARSNTARARLRRRRGPMPGHAYVSPQRRSQRSTRRMTDMANPHGPRGPPSNPG